MRQSVVFYFVTLTAYLALDAIWLDLTSASLYRAGLGPILLTSLRKAPGIAVYLLEVLGLLVFVMPRAEASGEATTALLYGGWFGVFTYGLYDLANYATLRHWSLRLVCTDVAWGAAVSGLSAAIGWSIASRSRGRRRFL